MTSRIRSRGFTLVELMAVMLIIGILIIFVTTAAMSGIRDSQREATRGTIAKLDNAMNQLVEAIQSQRVNPTNEHILWASFVNQSGQLVGGSVGPNGIVLPSDKATLQRAQVIASFDDFRAEIPDTFWVQDTSLNPSTYPINFAQQAFATGNGAPWDYVLPLGVNTAFNRIIPNTNPIQLQPLTPGTGIYGASYGAAAGLLRNLGNVPPSTLPGATQSLPQGADGVDNDADGFIDNIGEAYIQGGTANATVQASIAASLSQHKHVTARSEVLYALLVEGKSQFGAFLNKDDFTSKEIMDTDNDGLPEFVDAWGNPIQFFRWPVFYHSDVQRGVINQNAGPFPPYQTVFEQREQDSSDPNQTLMAVSWWSGLSNQGAGFYGAPAGAGFQSAQAFSSGNGSLSGPAFMFQNYFKMLVEPLSIGGANPAQFWDRSSNFFERRAYYTRFLILSGGPDGFPGVPILSEPAWQQTFSSGQPAFISAVLQLESQAAQYDLLTRTQNMQAANLYGTPFIPVSTDADSTNSLTFFDMGLDDITNHNLNSTAQVSAQ